MAAVTAPEKAGDVGQLAEMARGFAGRDPRELRREIAEMAPPETAEEFDVVASRIGSIVPPRFRGAKFESYKPQTGSQKVALAAAGKFANKALAGEPVMLALIGKQGTGKSHLLYAIARQLVLRNAQVYARPWYRLADELRYGGPSAFSGSVLESKQVRDQLWSQRIVLLDEVRPTASTAFDDTELAKFACHAYDSNLAVLITTNVSPLGDVMGPAAASRFTQIVIDGPDNRQEQPERTSGRDRAAGEQ